MMCHGLSFLTFLADKIRRTQGKCFRCLQGRANSIISTTEERSHREKSSSRFWHIQNGLVLPFLRPRGRGDSRFSRAAGQVGPVGYPPLTQLPQEPVGTTTSPQLTANGRPGNSSSVNTSFAAERSLVVTSSASGRSKVVQVPWKLTIWWHYHRIDQYWTFSVINVFWYSYDKHKYTS